MTTRRIPCFHEGSSYLKIIPMIHIPVLCQEVVDTLSPQEESIIFDGTFGAGGYSRALLDAANCRVIAMDRDENVLTAANDLCEENERFQFVQGCFADCEAALKTLGVEALDGFVMDVGVSSMQIDQAERGFSFQKDGPLDMRMGVGTARSAADIVNADEEGDLIRIIRDYGEEKYARRVAKAIIMARTVTPITTTKQLAEIIRSAVPFSRGDKIDPATRTFQGLRIAVNDELGQLQKALEAAERLLSPGGRLVVVSFHSLEDRIVKDFLRSRSETVRAVSRYLPQPDNAPSPSFRQDMRKPVTACAEEIARNSRARSAKLRMAIRTDAPPMGDSA